MERIPERFPPRRTTTRQRESRKAYRERILLNDPKLGKIFKKQAKMPSKLTINPYLNLEELETEYRQTKEAHRFADGKKIACSHYQVVSNLVNGTWYNVRAINWL